MKFSCQQKDLLNVLTIVGKSVQSNNTLPVLNNILISATKSGIEFTSTNLEMGIITSLDSNVEEEGEITIPAKIISSYVQYLKNEELHISTTDKQELFIKSPSSKTTIKGISAEEFPAIPKIDTDTEFTINQKDFLEAIQTTVFCSSVNSSRPILTGVLFESDGKNLTLVATDSFRLSEKKLTLKEKVATFKIIIPSKTLSEVLRIFSLEGEKEIKVTISSNQILFSTPKVRISSRLIEGNFPDYKQIIPKQHETQVELPKEETLFALKRISFFARENNNSVHLSIKGNKAIFNTESNQYGSEEDEIIITKDGNDNEISLNIEFLLELFNTLKTKTITFSMTNKIQPAVFTIPEDDSMVNIIMPLKI